MIMARFKLGGPHKYRKNLNPSQNLCLIYSYLISRPTAQSIIKIKYENLVAT